jgi:hypothetical protein
MACMPSAWLRLLPSLLLALCATAARGQIPVELREHTPEQLAREAFASDYGRLIAAEFGKILRESADADCLQAKKLDDAQLDERGRALLVRQSARIFDTYWKLYDTKRFEVALATRGGVNAKAEIIRLRKDPEVKKLLDLYQPGKLATVVDSVAEIVDRYTLLRRIKLKRRISPLAPGNESLLRANPSEQGADAVERFLKQNKSAQVKRWLALEEAMLKATEQSMDRNAMAKIGPSQLAAGLDAELAELCVAGAR